MNQIQRNTSLFEELSGEVTITDPTHPLFGQTLPLLTVKTYRSKTHVTVLLPTGRRRSLLRQVTSLESPGGSPPASSGLPSISVRTILPLARFVAVLQRAKEENHVQAIDQTIPTPPLTISSTTDDAVEPIVTCIPTPSSKADSRITPPCSAVDANRRHS
jgi:hypothetical protein